MRLTPAPRTTPATQVAETSSQAEPNVWPRPSIGIPTPLPKPVGADAFHFLKDTHRRLADEPLSPGSPYYEPLHEGNIQDDPVARMFTSIAFAPVESIQLFSGFSGSGKTTELLRLKQRLEQNDFVVVYANALDYLNPAEPVDITELLIVLAAAFGEAVAEMPGAPVLTESFWGRLLNFLTNTELSLSEAGISVEAEAPLREVFGKLKAGVDLKLELKTASSFRQNLQRVLNSHLASLQQQVSDFYLDAVQRIRRVKGESANIVFLFDQLEQMRGGLLTEQDVIHSVERIFTIHVERLRLPNIHVVYTAPPWLKFVTPGMVAMVLLPARHLWNNNPARTPTESNRRAFRSVVMKRLGEDGARRLLGDDEAERNRLIDILIDHSGGHLRDLLRMLRDVVLRSASVSALPVDAVVVQATINALRRDYLPIARSDARWLAEIARNRATALPDTEPGAINRLSRFLDSHRVLYFVNAEEWYDVHPLIRDEIDKVLRVDEVSSDPVTTP